MSGGVNDSLATVSATARPRVPLVAEVVAGRGRGETFARDGIAGVFPCEGWLRCGRAIIKSPMERNPRGAETAYLRKVVVLWPGLRQCPPTGFHPGKAHDGSDADGKDVWGTQRQPCEGQRCRKSEGTPCGGGGGRPRAR